MKVSSISVPVTVADALRLLWEADRYPQRGNEDAREAQRLEAEALALAATAESLARTTRRSSGSGFRFCATQASTPNARDAVMHALYDLFDPETENAP